MWFHHYCDDYVSHKKCCHADSNELFIRDGMQNTIICYPLECGSEGFFSFERYAMFLDSTFILALNDAFQSSYNFYGGNFISTANPVGESLRSNINHSHFASYNAFGVAICITRRTRTIACVLCVPYGKTHKCGHYCV